MIKHPPERQNFNGQIGQLCFTTGRLIQGGGFAFHHTVKEKLAETCKDIIKTASLRHKATPKGNIDNNNHSCISELYHDEGFGTNPHLVKAAAAAALP